MFIYNLLKNRLSEATEAEDRKYRVKAKKPGNFREKYDNTIQKYNIPTDIYINPTKSELNLLLKDSKYGELRFVVDPRSKKIYVGNADNIEHLDIIKAYKLGNMSNLITGFWFDGDSEFEYANIADEGYIKTHNKNDFDKLNWVDKYFKNFSSELLKYKKLVLKDS